MAFRVALAEELLRMIREKGEIIPLHKYYKTVSQKDRFEIDLKNTVLRWMDKYNVHVDLTV